jgi:hypothetical protein
MGEVVLVVLVAGWWRRSALRDDRLVTAAAVSLFYDCRRSVEEASLFHGPTVDHSNCGLDKANHSQVHAQQ